jgi:hypothetical protein
MTKLPEGDELPLSQISEEARALAEALHHEARTERIFSIIELALRNERLWMLDSIRSSVRGYPKMGGDLEIMETIKKLIETAYNHGLESRPPSSTKPFSIDHW